MNTQQYLADLAAGGAYPYPITVLRNEPMEDTVDVLHEDLSGAMFLAEVRVIPGAVGDPLAVLVVTVDDVQTKTYQEWITACALDESDLERCAELVDDVTISTITIASAESSITPLPMASQAGQSAELYYTLTQISPTKKILAAGPFKVVEAA